MNLHETLELVPYRELRIITRVQELTTTLRPPKRELIEVIEGALLDGKHLRRLLRKLSEDERAALDALIAAEGALPMDSFSQRFGEVQPFRPWRKGEPTHPWYSENEPAQQLAYWGLLYLHPRRPKPGQTQRVMIPADLLALLPAVPSPAQAAATPALQPMEHEQALLFDVTMLLSFINQEQPKALYKGRWMSRKNTEAVNERLMQPDEMAEVRSELQSRRVRFVHFLAESAGLMGVINNAFTVTPLGWQWLAASKKEQYQQLWQAWQVDTSEQGERWKRYRYLESPHIKVNLENEADRNGMDFHLPHPPLEEPLKLLQCLLSHLAKCKPEQSYQRSAFLNQLWTIEPEFWRFEIDFKTAIKRGWIEERSSASFWSHEEKPLNFAGWLEYETRPWNDKASKSKAMPPYLYDFLSQVMAQYLVWWDIMRCNDTHFSLTPIGNWLLKGTTSTPPSSYVEEEPRAFTINDEMIISVPLETPAETLVRLERIAQRLAHGKYQLTAKTVANGLTQEMTFDQLITFLHQESQTGLTQAQLTRLNKWHNQMSQVRLQRVTLLRTGNPQQMTELTRRRNLNKHILETLSSHSVIIDETKIEKISRHLEREGFLLTGIPPQTEFGQRRKRDKNQSAYLLYCAQIALGLRQWIDLPHPLPDYLVEQLEAELDPPTRTATEQAAQEALQRLQRVMDGYSSRHSWDIKSVPQDQCLSLIHQAIKKGHQLQLTYYSASRQVRTNRTIEPYRLEWSHQTPYLIAYCRQAHAERRFRVDRIEAIQLIEIEKPQHKENLQASWLA